MRYFNLYVLICLSAILPVLQIQAQPLSQNNIPIDGISAIQCSGTSMPYLYERRSQSAPPTGYMPFYINHLGRHGARNLTSASQVLAVLNVLDDAEQNSMLTARGKEIALFLTKFKKQSDDKWGQLTLLGKEEQRNLARRMIANYPAVFDPVREDSMCVFAISTSVHRCIESMDNFTSELKSIMPSLLIRTDAGKQFDSILRFFDCDPAYTEYKKEGKWRNEYERFYKQNTPVKRVKELLFAAEFSLPEESLKHFVNNLFEIHAILPDLNILFSMNDLFPVEDARKLWENGNLSQYLRKGPSVTGNGLPVDIAAPLLEDFLLTSRQAIEVGGTSADLRFAHAETLIPFAALLGIPQASARIAQPQQVSESWQDFLIAPMAGNIQWIFYKNASNEIIVKVLLNEQEVFLPVPSDIQPFYPWKDLYIYYKRITEALYQKQLLSYGNN